MSDLQALLIDLDDTLFDEHSYALSGYRFIAQFLAEKHGKNADEIYSALEYHFYKFGRNGAFDSTLKSFQIANQDIRQLVGLYRNHFPKISLYDGGLEAIQKFKNKFKIAIVTDGNAIMQKNKVLALKVSEYFDAVVYCHELGEPKPSVKAYQYAAKLMRVDINNCAIIGDDPLHDGKAAADLGIDFYRVLTGRFSNIRRTERNLEFDNILSVADFLEKGR